VAIIAALAVLSSAVFAESVPRSLDDSGIIIMKVGSKTMTVNGSIVEVDPGRDTAPIVLDNRTLIPARALIEAMGGTVGWEASAQKITIEANAHSVTMWLGSTGFVADGIDKTMDVAPTVINDRTLVPVRFMAENIGCDVKWIGATSEIIITYGQVDSSLHNYSEYNALVLDGFLMGGNKGNSLLSQEELFDLLKGNEAYKVYINGKSAGIEYGEKIPEGGEYGFSGNSIDLSVNIDPETDYYAGFSGQGELIFANPDKLLRDRELYKEEVDRLATEKGYGNAHLEIIDLFSIDLDNDGVNEVVVNASNIEAYYSGETDVFVTMLYVGLVKDDNVENLVINEYFFTPEYDSDGTNLTWCQYFRNEILGFCDLTGDGSYKILVRSYAVDLVLYQVHELRDGKMQALMYNGAGA